MLFIKGVKKADTVPDVRVFNKAEIAAAFCVSLPTINDWIRRDCPVMQTGGRGIAWKLDVFEVYAWRFGVGESYDEDTDPDKMPPKERLDWYRGEREKTKDGQDKLKLLPAVEYETDLSASLKVVAMTLESLPDTIERDAGIDGNAVELVQATIDRLREKLYEKLIALTPEDRTEAQDAA